MEAAQSVKPSAGVAILLTIVLGILLTPCKHLQSPEVRNVAVWRELLSLLK
jgi:hypothetical protein